MNALILLAGGSGSRMGSAVPDKILAHLNGKPVIAYAFEAFIASGLIDQFCIVYRDASQRAEIENSLQAFKQTIEFVQGGKTRQESVLNALQTLPAECTQVFIHDAARPLITAGAIKNLHAALETNPAAVLAHPVKDTIKRVPESGTLQATQLEDLDRSRLWAMETPQAFAFQKILEAYTTAKQVGMQLTDDAAAASHAGMPVTLVSNPDPNPKITRAEDFSYLESLLQAR